jgi:fatty-acyl-CoA synthase
MEPPARPRALSIIAEMPVTPVGKIFKPKLREIAAGEAARELLLAEGLAEDCQRRSGHRSVAWPLSAGDG